MEAIYYREWRDQHLDESFPFINSEKYFSNEIFVDLSIATYNSPNVWLNSLSASADLSGILSDDFGNSYTFSHTVFNISGSHCNILDENNLVKGKIVFGRNALNAIYQSNIDSIDIPPKNIRVVPSCVFSFNARQVSGLSINRKTYRGNIKFIEGDGVKITGTENNIIINAVGKKTPDECCPETGVVLKTINGKEPLNGSFFIQAKVVEQPTSIDSPRQLIKINNITDGLEISLAT